MAAMTQAQLPNFDSLWNYDDPEGTATAFRALIPQAEASHNSSYLAQLLTQLARTESLRGNFSACHEILNRVEGMLSDDLKLARVRYLLERGRAYNSAGDKAAALPLFTDAYTRADSIQERSFAVDALHMMAIAAIDPMQSIEWNRKAIALAEQDPPLRRWLVPLFNNIGEGYAAVNDYAHAQEYFHRLNELYRAAGKQPNMYSIKDEARMARLMGRPAESLAMIEPIDAALDSAGTSDGWICEEMAEALAALGRMDEARPHFATACTLLSADEWVLHNNPEKLTRLREMAGK